MKRLSVIPALLPLAALLAACISLPVAGGQAIEGSGTLAEDTRAVSGVTAVQLSMPGTLHIEIGTDESLRISADDNLLPYIETNARGGELDIRATPNVNLRPSKPIDYYLTVPSLDTISLTSSGSAEVSSLTSSHFTASISSSGGLTLEGLQAETLEVDISSSGSLAILGGSVERQTIRISSSGAYAAKDLLSQEATVRLSSSGSATIHVEKTLEATLSSSGNVHYLGSPQVNFDGSSSGRVIQITD